MASESIATHAPTNAAVRVLLLLGPPGCGKGTQAERIAHHLGIPAISTGEMIRAEIKAGTELGKVAQAVTITGGLLSDDLVNQIVASRLAQDDCAGGALLDGYPRSLGQAHYLDGMLSDRGWPAPFVIHIDVPHDQLVSRTCQRRFCPSCGHIYNLQTHPPKSDGQCDQCGMALQQRADDCEETVRNRLLAYDRTTAPLVQYYAANHYTKVLGTGSPEEVFQAISSTL
jgi:adenylate kinase